MKSKWGMILPLLVSGCFGAVSGDAVCDGVQDAIRSHAGALAIDGGPLSLLTGEHLIKRLDAGCANIKSDSGLGIIP